MFTVRFFVDEKKLGAALWALEGIAVGHPEVTPVRGAEVKNGRIKANKEAVTSNIEAVTAALTAQKERFVKSKELKAIVAARGGQTKSISHIIHKLQDQGILGEFKAPATGGFANGGYPVRLGKLEKANG